MKSEEVTKTLKCLRALDGIQLGIILLIPFIILQNLLSAFPYVLIKYFYIIPVFIIFLSSFKLPYDCYNLKDWEKTINRIRFFATGFLAISPFWAWWHQALENSYLLFNLLLLLIFAMLYIYNIVTLSKLSAVENKWKRFENFAKLTRLMIMYILIAPIIAFAFSVWAVKNTCWEIVIFIFQNQRLLLPLIIIPLLICVFLINQWKKRLEKI